MVAPLPPRHLLAQLLLDSPGYDADEAALSLELLRRGANALAVHSLFHTMRLLGLMRAAPSRPAHPTRVLARDLPYVPGATPDQRLDVWAPAAPAAAPRPAVIYIHGGGFRILSKNTHWMMARAFAEQGFVVFNINYRLGPEHPYPTPLEDAAAALAWVHAHAAEYGADPANITIAGESAGANLATSLTLMCCTRAEQPWARRVFDLNIVPRALVAACGLLQVSDTQRFAERQLPSIVMAPLLDACHTYMPPERPQRADQAPLADPLRVLESDRPLERPLPPIFAPVGTLDPLREDTDRLAAAVQARGGSCEASVYPGGVHSFMAFMWTARSRACWADTFAFLDQHTA
jgi:acetyl esterase